mmetsp:Transcript_21614/g.28931  ORF Transcript_21614/g.28931 Transcript_21614/m.28931 type:complete len:100 (+) Transcript_21614:49-348(+)
MERGRSGKLCQVVYDALEGRTPANESLRSVSNMLSNIQEQGKSATSLTAKNSGANQSRINKSTASGTGARGMSETEFKVEFPTLLNMIFLSPENKIYDG